MYQLKCLCGKKIQTKDREVVCGDCGRHLYVDWGEAPDTTSKPTKTATDKYEKHP